MNYRHCFVICAYQKSKYLEECIQSLKSQTVATDIVMVTSTPNEYISMLADKYKIPVCINDGEKGITQDWNFALSCVEADCITLAHQDDVYDMDYVRNLFNSVEHIRTPLIYFTDYSEIRGKKTVSDNKLLRIKRVMLLPFRNRIGQNSKWVRRRVLSLGSPICCPSVTYFIHNLRMPVFRHHFRTNEDWEAWEQISSDNGSFVYCPKILMSHRIHEESETTRMIVDSGRGMEDYEMYLKFWPRWIARILTRAYGTSEKSNQL